ncbi:unnamed protein product [Taenia asiatica]|uniref:Ovule protein n=1 Tax=Taenia asiatica TaxID=60517 RepID=A0A0R3VSP4_TAEAS|nr:unnamed protein product [Taenia asiatica]
MYCLRFMFPLLVILKPDNLTFPVHHNIYVLFTFLIFLLERKLCNVCTVILLAYVLLLCINSMPSQCAPPPCFTPLSSGPPHLKECLA